MTWYDFHLKVVSRALSDAPRCRGVRGCYTHHVKIKPWETESKLEVKRKVFFRKPNETDLCWYLRYFPLTRWLFCIGFRKLGVPTYIDIIISCCWVCVCFCRTWCRCCCAPRCPRTDHDTRGSRHRSPGRRTLTPVLILRDTHPRSCRLPHPHPHSHTQSWGNSQFERGCEEDILLLLSEDCWTGLTISTSNFPFLSP